MLTKPAYSPGALGAVTVKRPRILVYSDCSFFAGCENMPVTLLGSPEIGRKFDVMFAYRYSPKYADGLSSRVAPEAGTIPVRVFSTDGVLTALDRPGLAIVSIILRLTGFFTLLKYLFALHAVAVLFFLFKKIRPDILHINNGGYPAAHTCISAVFAAKLAGVQRVIFVVNSLPVPYSSFGRKLEKPIDGFVARNVSVFVTGSEYSGTRIREVFKSTAGSFLTIPNGISVRPMKESAEAVRERLKISEGITVLGNVAILEPRKGHKYLLEAMAIIRDKFPDFSKVLLIIEGVGSERERLEKLAAGLGIKENVRFLEREANVFDIMRIFDVFILSSIGYEDFPNVILEAMSFGKPVIGTRIAGIPEQILDGETGLVVAPSDAGALAGAVLRLLGDAATRSEMGRKGRERFESRFSYEKAIGNYEALYHRLMEGLPA